MLSSFMRATVLVAALACALSVHAHDEESPAGQVSMGRDPACPPEDEAALAAYAQCAAFQRQAGDRSAARTAEKHADKLRNACATTTSKYIDVDPYQDLLDCAQALAVAGRIEEARQVEPAAQAYRAEQVLRLHLQGAPMLDPARYMGRPVDYEAKRAGHQVPEQRMNTKEFSAAMPRGGGWKLVSTGPGPVIFAKDATWMTRRPVHGQSIVAAIVLRDPGFATTRSPEDFPRAFEEYLRSTTVDRFQLTHITTTHRGHPGEYCADYELTMEERGNPNLPGVVLEIAQHGFACLEETSSVVVESYYSERRPQGAPSVLDEVVRDEGEQFLRGVIVSPRWRPVTPAPQP